MLYIVATPIGNLGDIGVRALDVLKSVDLVACEDTRHTQILLSHYGIRVPTTSFFQHNRFTKGAYLLGLLKEGKSVALVSDAGTPGILDPGYNLIKEVIAQRLPLTVIPGPAAFVCALVLSGKPAHKFIFEGFLPNRSQARRNRLEKLLALDYTLVFYESCHRIVATLKDLDIVCATREIVCVRELTKKFEEIYRGTAKDILAQMGGKKPRGEFVLVV